LATRLVS